MQLKERYPAKTDASILLEQDISYDTIVQVMDTVRVSQVVDEAEGRVDRTDLLLEMSQGAALPLTRGLPSLPNPAYSG